MVRTDSFASSTAISTAALRCTGSIVFSAMGVMDRLWARDCTSGAAERRSSGVKEGMLSPGGRNAVMAGSEKTTPSGPAHSPAGGVNTAPAGDTTPACAETANAAANKRGIARRRRGTVGV
ncbi:MAG: hypothetical protein A2X37_08315 [Elusimicrobia bacterium GWA2_66_18]|nr:MAG: hypothetical protein A2X37_08315 [Elusimicrobia bacterium GWA2_66_18]